MKKRFFSLAVMMMASAFAFTMQAANYLTVTDAKGEKVSFALTEKPTISFTTSNLVLKASETTVTYPLTEYRSFELSDDNVTTSISNTLVNGNNPVFTFGDELHAEGLPAGSRLTVYTISGQMIGNAIVSSNGSADVQLGNNKGVFVVKSASKSFKFIKR